jgi:hypothetical protein|uniref:Uncharacterized protein n=1 Tax=Leptospirillum sp. Group II '5-way CG' TaxID=419541 RepID=B6AQ42_9BACT|nr:MAG: Hypothetical protein CGL2_10965012 [Leptospirillum sp. Group II '5-way CG']
MTDPIFIEVNRIIYTSGDTEALYFDRQIVGGEVYVQLF